LKTFSIRLPNRSAVDFFGLPDMRVPFTLLVICGTMSGSAALLPIDAADFLDQGLVDPIGFVALPVVTPSAPVRATLSTSDVDEAQDTAPVITVVRPPKIKTVPSVVRVITGDASWYGQAFFGNRMTNGEVDQRGKMTAAHRILPFGTQVRVTNLWNGQSEVIRNNDRGPFVHHRVIDLGHGAASSLGLTASGITQVRLEVLR
jgi:rare lipoprotein A